MLRVESAHIDAEGRPIVSRVEDYPDMMHEKAYSMHVLWGMRDGDGGDG